MPDNFVQLVTVAEKLDAELRIAAHSWPQGIRLTCPTCGYSNTKTAEQSAKYLRDGFPRCTGLKGKKHSETRVTIEAL